MPKHGSAEVEVHQLAQPAHCLGKRMLRCSVMLAGKLQRRLQLQVPQSAQRRERGGQARQARDSSRHAIVAQFQAGEPGGSGRRCQARSRQLLAQNAEAHERLPPQGSAPGLQQRCVHADRNVSWRAQRQSGAASMQSAHSSARSWQRAAVHARIRQAQAG